MKRIVGTLIASVLIHGIAVAGQLPDSIASLKLGQQRPKKTELNKVTFANTKGKVLALLDENGGVETLRFACFACSEMEEESCGKDFKKNLNNIKNNLTKSFGKPNRMIGNDYIWENNGRWLTLGQDYIGGQLNEIAIYLQNNDEKKPGGSLDGFKEFYYRFTQAFNDSDRGQLIDMMKFPFEGNCGLSIKRENSFDGNLKKVVESVNPELRDPPFFSRISNPRMYFSSYFGNGIGFNKIKGKWYAVGVYCSE